MATATLWTFLISVAAPILYRVLAALGMGWITITAYSYAFDSLKLIVQDNFSSVSSSLLMVISLARVPESIGIILGGLAFRVAFASIPRLGKLPS